MADFCSTCATRLGLPDFDIRAEPGSIVHDLCEGCGQHWFDEHGVRRRNIRFHYLYRDAGNYKQSNTVVFGNDQRGLTETEVEQAIAACLHDGDWFKAERVGLSVCFFDEPPTDDDHPWHEFDCVEETDDPPTDPRDIAEFLEAMQQGKRDRWR
jgi:hypothetical protein